MRTKLVIGIILALIIGLVGGFFGGYQYKSLNAATSTAPSQDAIDTAVLQNDLRITFTNGVIEGLNELGTQSLFGVAPLTLGNTSGTKVADAITTSSNPALDSIINKIKDSLLPAALAQTACGGSAEQLSQYIAKGFDDDNANRVYKNNYCVKTIATKADIKYTLWNVSYTKPDGAKGAGQEISFTMTGTYTITSSVPDPKNPGQCKDSVVTKNLPTMKNIGTVNFGNGWEPIPSDYYSKWKTTVTVVCKGDIKYDHTWTNPKYDAKKCCGLIVAPTPTATSTAVTR